MRRYSVPVAEACRRPPSLSVHLSVDELPYRHRPIPDEIFHCSATTAPQFQVPKSLRPCLRLQAPSCRDRNASLHLADSIQSRCGTRQSPSFALPDALTPLPSHDARRESLDAPSPTPSAAPCQHRFAQSESSTPRKHIQLAERGRSFPSRIAASQRSPC